jgi:hypothetical protein
MQKIMEIIRYFFTPEDSATPIQRSVFSFSIEAGRIGIGSAKALFWVMTPMMIGYLISLL